MSTVQFVGIGYVNGDEVPRCELRIEQESQVVRSRGPRPDPAWTFTDDAGHFHAYDVSNERNRYPTLRDTAVNVPCNGSCGGVCEGEGYTVIEYSCRICGQDVDPGLIHGEYSFLMPGPKAWTALVPRHPPIDRELSFRFETSAGDTFYGFGVVTSAEVSSDGSGSYEVAGITPLGRNRGRLADAPS